VASPPPSVMVPVPRQVAPSSGLPPIPSSSGAPLLPAPVPGASPSNPFGFTTSMARERVSQKLCALFFGDTDGGKTTQAFDFGLGPRRDGRILCLSIDNKSKRIKVGGYANARELWIVDAQQHYADAQPELQTWSANVTSAYIDFVLDTTARTFRPHWIMFDGFDREKEVAAMKMRYLHGLKPSQGFKERAWWQDRRAVIRAHHRKAMDRAACGVIYTCYYKEVFAEEGEEHVSSKTPGWFDVVFSETDLAFDCRSSYSAMSKSKSYEVYVLKAKEDLSKRDLPTFVAHVGDVVDVSGKRYPWGPGVAAMIERANRAIGPLPADFEWPVESDVPSEVGSSLPPPVPSPVDDPVLPAIDDVPERPRALPAVAGLPAYPPPTAPAPQIPTSIGGVDLTAPPAKRTSDGEM
jgi:hypothetical protein